MSVRGVFITFADSSTDDTFCIKVATVLHWGVVIPKRSFPHKITHIFHALVSWRTMYDLIAHELNFSVGNVSSVSNVNDSACTDGTTFISIPISRKHKLCEFVRDQITKLMNEPQHRDVAPNTLSATSLNSAISNTTSEKSKKVATLSTVIDLTSLPHGINWIRLGKKSKPYITTYDFATCDEST